MKTAVYNTYNLITLVLEAKFGKIYVGKSIQCRKCQKYKKLFYYHK